MAILDKALIFFNNEAVIGGDVANIDLGAGGDAIGQELTLTLVANEDIPEGDTFQFLLGTADKAISAEDEENFPDGTAENGALVLAPMIRKAPAGGVIFQCRVPKGAKRYLHLLELNGSGTSGKKISAYLSKEL